MRGPSVEYLQMLRGEIAPKAYAEIAKARAAARLHEIPTRKRPSSDDNLGG